MLGRFRYIRARGEGSSMFSHIRRRITYANVAATLAVLFAMTGGALAASKYVITSTKQIKPSVLAQIKGKTGAPGKNGTPGAQGAQGPAGPAGTPGAKGNDGANGTNGNNGTNGLNGGTGPKGATGATGQTGFTETLPSGKTETGTWSVAYSGPQSMETYTPISFPIPLKQASAEAFFISRAETQEIENEVKPSGLGGCAGKLASPTAPKGVLCIYTEEEDLEEASLFGIFAQGALHPGYNSAGAFLDFHVEETVGHAKAHGTWAVTAP
jgi:hypothetical protein